MSGEEAVRGDVPGLKKGVPPAAAGDGALAALLSPEALVALRRKEIPMTDPMLAMVTVGEQQGDGKAKASDKKEPDWFRTLPPKELATALSPLTDLMMNAAIVSAARKPIQLSGRFNKDFEDFGKAFKAGLGRELTNQDFGNPAAMVDTLRDNPALLRQYDTLLREAGVYRTAADQRKLAFRMVTTDAQKVLNDICRTSHLPAIKFGFSEDVTTPDDALLIGGSYKVGSAVFSLPVSRYDENLAAELTKKGLTSTFAHELDHHRQFSLVTAKAIADVSPDKPLGDQEIKTIQKDFKTRFGIEATREFILDVEKSRKGHPLTENEIDQAKTYGQSYEKYKELRGRGLDLVLFKGTEELLDKRNALEAIELFNELRAKYPLSTPLDEIAPLLEQQRRISAGELPRTSWDEAAAKKTLKSWFTKTSAAVRRSINGGYNDLTVEREADAVGAEAARTIP